MHVAAPAPASSWAASPVLRWSVGIIVSVIFGILVFEAFDVSVFKRIGMAHEYCYLREPKLIWLHVTSDVLIGVAYVSISATLTYLVYRASRDIPFNWVFLAFGLFIVSCGMTHFMEVWVVWEPVYWMSGYVKVVTAAASVATAVALFPLVPKVFRLIESVHHSERRRVEIEQLNDELERFNYTVAHDLRAPLRGITGLGQALREDCAGELSPTAKGYIEKMQGSAARMDALICDLLKYATIGRQELKRRPIPSADAVRAALAMLEAQVRESRANILIASDLPTVVADATLLEVVFQNLIANAIKFVEPGVVPEIAITAQGSNGRVLISVTDNGLGVPTESRAQIFGMFERLHPGQSGSGIGLAIVYRAIERLDGRVGVDAAAHGTGSRFWIELPRA